MCVSSAERNAAFRKVEAAYARFYQDLGKKGAFPYRSTSLGMWAVSDARGVYRAFCHFDLSLYAHMADLGSGDGKVALIASLFTRTTGFEIDSELYHCSLKIRDELSRQNVRFLQQDYLQADLTPYDLLYLYPDKPFHHLEEKLLPVWQGRLLVNGPHFSPRSFRKIAESPPPVGRFVLYEST